MSTIRGVVLSLLCAFGGNLRILKSWRNRKMRKLLFCSAMLSAALLMTLGVTASAQTQSTITSVTGPPVFNDTKGDRKDIRQDTKEIRADRRDVRSDRRDIREDRKEGESKADLKADLRDLHRDRHDLRTDRRDRRADTRDFRRDRHGR